MAVKITKKTEVAAQKPLSPSDKWSKSALTSAAGATQYLSTIQTAKILDLSVGTVQKLVETNELHAWKTKGGHRRISVASVETYKRYSLKRRGSQNQAANGPIRVLFLDNDEKTLVRIQKALKNTPLVLDCIYTSSGLEAMLQLPAHQPDVIFLALNLKDIDGTDLLRKLDQTNTIAKMGMVAWSSIEEAAIGASAGLPKRVLMIRKPVNTDWITGYLSAVGNALEF